MVVTGSMSLRGVPAFLGCSWRGGQVILTGIMDEWPAFKDGSRKWTIDFFRRVYGDVLCPVDACGEKKHIPLSTYLDSFSQYDDLPGRHILFRCYFDARHGIVFTACDAQPDRFRT